MNLVSLFDGCAGAMDSALAAGLRPAAHVAVEIDPVARKLADWRAQKNGWLEARRPVNDVREATAKNLLEGMPPGEILLIAGVPCQTRSRANTAFRGAGRVAENTESGLVHEFARVLAELRAAGREVKFVVENVPSAAAADAEFNRILGVSPILVNAAAFGAQHRQRLFWSNCLIRPRDKPTAEWSAKTFRDIAEENPVVKKWYDFIPYPAKNPKPFCPARVGVLATEKIIEEVRAGHGIPALPQTQLRVYDEESKTRAVQNTASHTTGIVGALDKVNRKGGFGGGISLTSVVHSKDRKTTAMRAQTTGIIGALSSPVSRRVNSGAAKTPPILNGRVRTEGAISVGQKDRIHSADCKAPANLAFRSGGYHQGKVATSVQDRVMSRGGEIKTIPANGGGRTEGIVGDGGRLVERDFGGGLILQVVEKGARCLTITEIERLFGLPDGETAMPGLSATARKRALGGGWHRWQMAWVLSHLEKPARLV